MGKELRGLLLMWKKRVKNLWETAIFSKNLCIKNVKSIGTFFKTLENLLQNWESLFQTVLTLIIIQPNTISTCKKALETLIAQSLNVLDYNKYDCCSDSLIHSNIYILDLNLKDTPRLLVSKYCHFLWLVDTHLPFLFVYLSPHRKQQLELDMKQETGSK